jgi:hypothetical protein
VKCGDDCERRTSTGLGKDGHKRCDSTWAWVISMSAVRVGEKIQEGKF